MDSGSRRLVLWTAVLGLAAVATASASLGPKLLDLGMERILAPPSPQDVDAVLMRYSLLPRLAAALLCGAALAMAGALLQQVLRNPLASPSTIGVEAGAGLAIAVATLFAPALLGWSRDGVALLGGGAAVAAVFAIAGRFGFAPLAVVLGGLVVGLYLGAVTTTLSLLFEHRLAGLFVWGSGSLAQHDWNGARDLLPRLGLAAAAAGLLARPLVLLQLDEAARGLGVRVALVRALALATAVALTGFTVSAVGVIGFLGLAAPAIARAAGARRFATRLIVAPVVGACLLVVTDQSLQLLGQATGLFLPAGAITAMLGAPALFLLVRRLPAPAAPARRPAALIRRPAAPRLLALGVALACVMLGATVVGRGVGGTWVMDIGNALEPLLIWRLPRTTGAAAAGTMLAIAGVLLQRMTRNPMASPEVLGVSAGAACGLLISLFAVPGPDHLVQTVAASGGAMAALATLLLALRRTGLAGDRALLAGVALAAFLMALLSVVTATGDPRAMLLLGWMAGSTYQVDAPRAVVAAGVALAAVPLVPVVARHLELVSLGPTFARGAGVAVERAQLLLLALAGVLTAVATLIVGPLSFVGLMAPHLARRAGLVRCLPQLAGAGLIGALLLAVADFVGRTAHFPWQLPAGLMSALIGGPVLVCLMIRGRRA